MSGLKKLSAEDKLFIRETFRLARKAEGKEQLIGALKVATSGALEPLGTAATAVMGARSAAKAGEFALKRGLPKAVDKVKTAQKTLSNTLAKGKGSVSLAKRKVAAKEAKAASAAARKELSTLLDKTIKPQLDKIKALKERLAGQGKIYTKKEKAKIGEEISQLTQEVRGLRNQVKARIK